MGVLTAYDWPGNVRELENLVYRSAVVAGGEAILRKDLPDELLKEVGGKAPASPPSKTPFQSPDTSVPAPESPKVEPAPSATFTAPPPPLSTLEAACDQLYQILRGQTEENILSEIEREMMVRALKEFDGNQVKTSKLLGITRATLRKRIEQLDLKV